MPRDPIEAVKAKLREAGAVYRGGGTKAASSWEFPDHSVFVFERRANNPTIDARVASRKLNQFLAARSGLDQEPMQLNGTTTDFPAPAPQALTASLAPAPQKSIQALDVPKSSSMRERWTLASTQAKACYEKLMSDAAIADRRVKMLDAMIPFLDEPTFADTLLAVLPSLEVTKIAEAPAAPPQQIQDFVQVTRPLVFAATQTFDDPFTVNDVVERMLNGREVPDRRERHRIRMSVASAMIALLERGELLREQQGIGRKQSVWKKTIPVGASAEVW